MRGLDVLLSIAAQIAPPHVITHDIQDVRTVVCLSRQRPQKVKPVNYFVNETSKPSPALEKKKPVTTETFRPGDTVKHASFGVGVVLTVRPMGGDTLYEIAFDKVGTKKLMATYARLTRL